MTDMTEEHTGGCLCGAVRYRALGPAERVVTCHCTMCQKSGAPMLIFANFLAERVTFVRGAPRWYKSSSFARRGFCETCGGQLAFRFEAHPERISLSLGSIDDGARLAPDCHIYTTTKIPWLHLADGLPEHPGGRGYDDPDGSE